MMNPKLTKKEERLMHVREGAKKLFQVIYQEQQNGEKSDDSPKIKVSTLISKLAFYYEKIRNSVDYKEEHLLRKNAILRILKRQIVIEGAIVFNRGEGIDIAKHLLIELIRAGYLPNNKVPEKRIGEIGKVVDKYLYLRKLSLSQKDKNDFSGKNELSNWLISMLACDIEGKLGKNKIEQMVISNMYETLNDMIILADDSPYEKDKAIQIFTGIHRYFLKFDDDLINFILFKYFNEGWEDADEEKLHDVARKIEGLKSAISEQLLHPMTKQLGVIIGRYTVFFSVLLDVISEDPVNVYNSFKADPKAFPRDIKKICNIKYKVANSRLWRAAFRSIVYIFLTKSIFVIILEIPAIKWMGEELNYISLAINVAFPAFLLFLVVLLTKRPGDENTAKIVKGINELVFEEEKKSEPYQLRRVVKRGAVLNFIFSLIYTAAFFSSVVFVVWGLGKIDFSWVSIIIFLFFLALVSFFAIRIRRGIQELMVMEKKESVFGFFLDFFYIPIVSVGKWLSEKFSRVNVFVFILDFIIEAPFKIFVEMAEEWTKYVKERKEDIM